MSAMLEVLGTVGELAGCRVLPELFQCRGKSVGGIIRLGCMSECKETDMRRYSPRQCIGCSSPLGHRSLLGTVYGPICQSGRRVVCQ